MNATTASAAREKLNSLIDEAAHGHPIQISSKRNSAALVGEDDWRAIQETLYLFSVPGMRASIRRGLKNPVSKLSKKPGW